MPARIAGDGWRRFWSFVYHPHYALALGELGKRILGITALAWTLDCFVAFYPTPPPGRRMPVRALPSVPDRNPTADANSFARRASVANEFGTQPSFDTDSGALKYLLLPSGQYTDNAVSHWLYALHTGNVFGLPYRILVSLLGLAIVLLSVTGVEIWPRRHRPART